MTEKCKISLQNVISISFLHTEKHNYNHIEIDIEKRSEKGVLKNLGEAHFFIAGCRPTAFIKINFSEGIFQEFK